MSEILRNQLDILCICNWDLLFCGTVKVMHYVNVFLITALLSSLAFAQLKGSTEVSGLKMYLDKKGDVKDPICSISKGDQYEVLGRRPLSNANLFEVILTKHPKCKGQVGYVLGAPFSDLKMDRRALKYEGTTPVVVRSVLGEGMTPTVRAFSSVDGLDKETGEFIPPVCEIPINKIVYAVGELKQRNLRTQVLLPDHIKCIDKQGKRHTTVFMSSKSGNVGLAEEKFDEWHTGCQSSMSRGPFKNDSARGPEEGCDWPALVTEGEDKFVEAMVVCEECVVHQNKQIEQVKEALKEIVDPREKMIKYAIEHKSTYSRNESFRSVKLALQSAGLVKKYLEPKSAEKAGWALRQEGFKNLLMDSKIKDSIKSPYDAPRGAVLVYSGGLHGSIEIKTGQKGQGGFVSDHSNDVARTGTNKQSMYGRNRTLIGVYIKPEVE